VLKASALRLAILLLPLESEAKWQVKKPIDAS
jgi:hypothetical protein